MRTEYRFGLCAVVCLVGAGVIGCGAPAPGTDAGEDGELLGEASVALTTVPTGAQCLQVTGSSGLSFSVTAPLTSGSSSATLSLGRLPLGTGTINASVFNAACSALAGQTATWVADPQTATFRVGVVTSLTLNLRQNNDVGVNANFIGNISDISAGWWTTALVMADGTVRTAGYWDPALPRNLTLLPTAGFSNVVEFVPSRDGLYSSHACLRTNAGAIQCFGKNVAGALGPSVAIGGSSNTAAAIQNIPSHVADLQNGMTHSCVLTSGGYVTCWGGNSFGQLGNNSTTNSSTPVNTGLPVQVLLAVGHNFTCTYNQHMSCWGQNSNGQLGDGTTTQRNSPNVVWAVTGAVSLAAGENHACYVRADGTAWCWGANGSGQLGDGTTTQRLTPTQVVGITDALEVVAGDTHTCLRRTGGTVSCFGRNSQGECADGTGAATRPSPVTVPGVTGAAKLVAGSLHTCALLENRQITCWGSNQTGEGADGTLGDNYRPSPAIVQ